MTAPSDDLTQQQLQMLLKQQAQTEQQLQMLLKQQAQTEQQLRAQSALVKELLLKQQAHMRMNMLSNEVLFTQQLEPVEEYSVPTRPLAELAVVAVARNEGPYFREWLEYHRLVGVSRFYIYDNGSTDETREVLEPYISDGTVVYRRIDGFKILEFAYNDAICRYRFEAKWMALIDLDEFLVPVVHDSVTDFLREFERENIELKLSYKRLTAIAVNWLMFDSNDHETKPTAHGGLVTANYTRVRTDHNTLFAPPHNDRICKCIINPRMVRHWISEHCGIYYGGYPTLNENHEEVPLSFSNANSKFYTAKRIRINHYHCKSRAEYMEKMQRNAYLLGGGKSTGLNEEKLVFTSETEQDTVIFRFLPALKQALGIKE